MEYWFKYNVDMVLYSFCTGVLPASLRKWSLLYFLRVVGIIVLHTSHYFFVIITRKFHTRPTAFWGFVIMVSKVVEFGDTAFVVLRKTVRTFKNKNFK